MDRFEYTEARFAENEVHVARELPVRLYDGEKKTHFESGEVVLTNLRILWGRPGDIPRGMTCLSLSLHLVIYVEEESPTFSFTRAKKLLLYLQEPHEGKNPGPIAQSPYNYVKLSFREGLSADFVQKLNDVLQSRHWESVSQIQVQISAAGVSREIKTRTGIVGIERGIQEKQKATDESISKAFQDLSKLMEMAKDMVQISRSISTKIREKQGDITEDETVRFKSYLLSLGIDDPVTRDSYKSDNQYYKSLARQIADTLVQPISEVGGMMALTDVYCRMNRARGLELLSPEDLLNGCRYLEQLGLPIKLHQFESGVMVLQLQSLNNESVIAATLEMLEQTGSLSAEELAQSLGISVMLAKERLLTTEKFGKACRDDSIEGLRFYPNQFLLREE